MLLKTRKSATRYRASSGSMSEASSGSDLCFETGFDCRFVMSGF